MRAAAGLQIDAGDIEQSHLPCPVGGFTDMVRTSSGVAASSSSLIQRAPTL